jgi:hypothetical protein
LHKELNESEQKEHDINIVVSTDYNHIYCFDAKLIKNTETNTIDCVDSKNNPILEIMNNATHFTFYNTSDIKIVEEPISTGLQNILFFTGIVRDLGDIDEDVNSRNFTSGYNNIAGVSDNIVCGRDNEAEGKFNAVFGQNNIAKEQSFASGADNKVLQSSAGAVGTGNTIRDSGIHSFVSGQNNTIRGSACLGSGTSNTIKPNGANSFVCGQSNTIDAPQGFACGKGNFIWNKFSCCFVGGEGNQVGRDNKGAHYCFVYGKSLLGEGPNQVVFGKYNKTSADALFIIGNGTSNARKNALVLNKDEELEVKSTILFSENGTKFRVKVSNDGTLITEKVEVE